MLRYFKIGLIVFTITITTIALASNYMHYKMKEELIVYFKLADDMKKLNDTYILCSGLLTTNPSKSNINGCNLVFDKIKEKVTQIEEQCPYISFYTKYIQEI